MTPSLHLQCGDNHFVVPCAFSEYGEEILARHKIKYFLLYRNVNSYTVKNIRTQKVVAKKVKLFLQPLFCISVIFPYVFVNACIL